MDDRIIIDPKNAKALKRMLKAATEAHDSSVNAHPAVVFDGITQRKVLQVSRLDVGAIKAAKEANIK